MALIAAGCGGGPKYGSAGGGSTTSAGATTSRTPAEAPAGAPAGAPAHTAAAWLGVSGPPQGWPTIAIPAGAQMPYPPGWHPAKGDRGTATALQRGSGGTYVGYLNLTPRQGNETLANWTSFRISHNLDEGDRTDRKLAEASNLHFPTGTGSCVRDAYTTKTSAHYVELACLIVGRRTTVVIVGAAPPGSWARQGGEIGRAIAGVTA